MEKKANILTENIIFLILNIVFLMILVIFLFSKTGSAAVLEEKYAKQIALIIDSVEYTESRMTIHLNMEDAIKIANKEERNLNQVVSVQDNIVTVQLREKGGYRYSFFNDLVYDTDFSIYPDDSSPPIKEFIIFVGS